MTAYIVTIGSIFVIMLIGIGVDRLYRSFAARNPKLGPFRSSERGCSSCSGGSGCSGGGA